MASLNPIGIFDSGFGGLTVLRQVVKLMPGYDYLYLGDNAHAPYGSKSFDTIYHLTLRCVNYLFDRGCPLVVLACNTASAKALRTIQQVDLPKRNSALRVLGMIRPVTEAADAFTQTGHLGIFATEGTVNSGSYVMEIAKFFPQIRVTQEACPMWVPLIECGEHTKGGADYFVKQHADNLMHHDEKIDAVILGCTHYPLMQEKIAGYLPQNVKLIAQGEIVAAALHDYLRRHPEMNRKLSQHGTREFLTTDNPENFNRHGSAFFGSEISSHQIEIPY